MTSYAYQTAGQSIPTQVSGCQIWYDGTDPSNTGVLPADSATISTWSDKSGNGNNATASVAATYSLTNKAIVFNNSFYTTSYPADPTNETAFVVFSTASTSQQVFIGAPTGGREYSIYNDNLNKVGVINSLIAWGATAGTFVLNTPQLMVGQIATGTSTYASVNGALTLTGPTLVPAFTSGLTTSLGRENGNAQPMTGNFYEFILYNSVLSVSDRQLIEGYLAWKWKFVSYLPPTHPYRSSAPGFLSPYTTIRETPAPLFTPMQLSNCVLWLDAADRSTTFFDTAGTIPSFGNGNQVAYWEDKSGTGNHASNTGFYPSLLTNYQNGRNALNFSYTVNVSCNYLLLDSTKLPNGSTNSTYFFVTRTESSAVQVFFSQGPATFATGQAPQYYYNNYNYYADLYGSNAVTDTTTYNSVWAFTTVTAGATMIGYDNGNLYTGGTNNVTINPFNVGTGFAAIGITKVGAGLSLPYAGQIGEIICYSRVLNDTERKNVEGYLAWKWNTTTYLPSTHPYKTVVFNALPPFPNVTLGRYLLQQTTWLPTSINNLSLWLDAADKTTITGTNPVTGWTDKSSSPRTITFSGTSTYNSSTRSINTTNNPTNYFYANLNLRKSQVTYVTVFIVHTWTGSSLSSANQALWGQDIGGGWNRFQLLGFTANSSFAYGLSYTPSSPNVTVASALNTANRVIYSATYAYQITNGTFAYVNGTLATGLVTEAVSPGETTTTNTYFATIDTGYSGQVAFHEIIIYTQEISAVQRQTVEGYLAWKWGLVASLPSNHPYKLFPPLPA